MKNLFNSVRRSPVRYNNFNLSFPNFFTADYGILYPCLVKEVQAGEVFRDYSENMVRTMPLRAPAFVRTDASVHYFFVPNRLVYDDWTKFIVRGDDGNTDYDKPYIDVESFVSEEVIGGDQDLFRHGSLMDYLNFPTLEPNVPLESSSTAKVDMMPFNAYQLIYNEYYRDENLIPEAFIWKHSGFSQNFTEWQSHMIEVLNDFYDNPTDPQSKAEVVRNTFPFYFRYRAWRKDYFTSALPFVQKGVPISLAGSIQGAPGQTGIVGQWFSGTPTTQTQSFYTYFARPVDSQGTDNVVQLFGVDRTGQYTGDTPENHSNPAIGANQLRNSGKPLSVVTPISGLQSSVMTVSDLRVGLALQQWFELNARVGSDRYFEYLLGHFGVRDRDARLQRPEYLGGFTHPIQISEVEQTSATVSGGSTPQGNLAGKGLGYAANRRVQYRFPEPGFVMAIFSIRPQPVYYQGLPRAYTRWDAFDYYDPLFDHLSEQPIYTSELQYDWSFPVHGERDLVFGYTPRYAEYRTSLPEAHGDFRSSLSYWISPRVMNDPVLNKDFIEVNGYTQGLYQSYAYVGTAEKPSPHFYVHMQHNISILRPMSKYATPKL